MTAFRALGSWRGDGSFGAWLARIGVRIALRRATDRKRVVWIDAAEGDRSDTMSTPTAAGTIGEIGLYAASDRGRQSSADPAAAYLRAEKSSAVRSAVAALDEPYREVVALRFFGELSLLEIAAVSGRPLGTVKTHLRRGLLRLRPALERGGVE